uniref:Uncharacterized protein n=1 Tax=Rhizophora mucronata TaxID=61149 RepID=A0A2P2L847_RHIMU
MITWHFQFQYFSSSKTLAQRFYLEKFRMMHSSTSQDTENN